MQTEKSFSAYRIIVFIFATIIFTALLSFKSIYASQVIWDPNIIDSTYGPGSDLPQEGSGVTDTESSPDTESSVNEDQDTSTSATDSTNTTSSDTSDQDTTSDADAQALIYSLSVKNTPIPSSQSNIVFINGRAIDLLRPVIALTYDDGPQESVGNQIMNIMAAYNSKCTFFLVGDRVANMITEVQRMVAEGHEVANHTYSHTYLNRVSAGQIIDQVTACNNILEQVTGMRPTLMRLPGGNKNQTVLSNVNMPIILWNIDTRDWESRNAQSTINAVIGKVKSGDIVLMHELYQSTADATTVIVPTLINQGFQLVTVSEMAALRGVTLSSNTVYYSM